MISGQGNGNLPKLVCGSSTLVLSLAGHPSRVKRITFVRIGSFAVSISSEAGSDGRTLTCKLFTIQTVSTLSATTTKNTTTLTPGLIQAVCKKTAGSHVALQENISATVWVTDLVEVSKDAESLVVCTQKNFFGWGCGFFVSNVISGGLFGQLHLALGANC